MKLLMNLRSVIFTGALVTAVALMTGCGGVSEAQMLELQNLQKQVTSLEAEANSLREERTALEKEIQEKNLKLAQCEKQKEETKANLEKMSK